MKNGRDSWDDATVGRGGRQALDPLRKPFPRVADEQMEQAASCTSSVHAGDVFEALRRTRGRVHSGLRGRRGTDGSRAVVETD